MDKLSILQRSSLSELELEVVKQEWLVTFADVPDQGFSEAARRARLRKPFFPTEADIIAELRLMGQEAKAKARDSEIRDNMALPMGKPSQEYLDKVKHHTATILAMVRRNVDARSGRA